MAVSGNLQASVNISDTQSIGINSAAKNVGISTSWQLTITDGTGAGAANKLWSAKRTLSGSSEDLDLTGSLAMVVGTFSPTRITGFGVRNLSTSATLVLGAASSNAWATFLNSTGTLTLRPRSTTNDSFIIVAAADATAYAVTAGTGDILKVAGTNGEQYEIFFVGS